MTAPPTIVHRYTFPVKEAIEHLLGEAAGDAEAWRIRIEEGELVVDMVAPQKAKTLPVNQIPEEATSGQPEPELKGGPLARRAAIVCAEKSLWLFVDVEDAGQARAWILTQCKTDSRRKLDHDERAGRIWRAIDGNYRLWLEGHDREPLAGIAAMEGE